MHLVGCLTVKASKHYRINNQRGASLRRLAGRKTALMMTSKEVLNHVTAEPFRSYGKLAGIRNPASRNESRWADCRAGRYDGP